MGLAKLRIPRRIPLVPEVRSIGIVGLDQREFPFAPPFLDQLFTGDGVFDFLVPFGVDLPCLGEVLHVDRAKTLKMLPHMPPRKRFAMM